MASARPKAHVLASLLSTGLDLYASHKAGWLVGKLLHSQSFGSSHSPPFTGLAVYVAQLFDKLLVIADVEVGNPLPPEVVVAD